MATKDISDIHILTEWDEFKNLDCKEIYGNMQKPILVLDGKNAVNAEKPRVIGFIVYTVEESLLKSCIKLMFDSILNTRWSSNHSFTVNSFVFENLSTCVSCVQGVTS